MAEVTRFRDRREAGRQLAARLGHLRDERPIVVGLPRGGIPVAFEVADALGAPLDVIVVRKLGVPFQPELGMGAIGEDGVRVLNDDTVRIARVPPAEVDAIESRERLELDRRAHLYRGGRPMIPLAGRTVVVVDDGIATGGTARAALEVARAHGARRVVLAVPVAPPETVHELARFADEIVTVATPSPFSAVGQWYERFTQTADDEVVGLLAAVDRRDEDVTVVVGGTPVHGHVTLPHSTVGAVVFAHGSGSSQRSPRNRYVARELNRAGLGTLLVDLLTAEEAGKRDAVFDVELLAARLGAVTSWLRAQAEAGGLGTGYFGASTGAAAALWAASDDPSVRAVVSRGGRPDLARTRLAQVRAPTLLIVGGRDEVVLELTRSAADQLAGEHRLDVVPGATHLFEEPGALETVAVLARDWFLRYL
jgi:putative phosphoribosyl transferase